MPVFACLEPKKMRVKFRAIVSSFVGNNVIHQLVK